MDGQGPDLGAEASSARPSLTLSLIPLIPLNVFLNIVLLEFKQNSVDTLLHSPHFGKFALFLEAG